MKEIKRNGFTTEQIIQHLNMRNTELFNLRNYAEGGQYYVIITACYYKNSFFRWPKITCVNFLLINIERK